MAKMADLTGQRFGKWTVLGFSETKNKHPFWKCICDCGTEKAVEGSGLRNGRSSSCGCWKLEYDLTGRVFGRLTVIRLNIESKSGHNFRWDCKCECGNEIIAIGSNLTRSHTSSCGCLREEERGKASITHGMRKTKTYKSWICMRERCTRESNDHYSDYGGRGIIVCDRWLHSFENFLEDMGERPEGTTIDRKDVNGNYEPSNCRWATKGEQGSNKRNSLKISFNGKEQTIPQWSRELGIAIMTIRNRLYKKNWTIEQALTK